MWKTIALPRGEVILTFDGGDVNFAIHGPEGGRDYLPAGKAGGNPGGGGDDPGQPRPAGAGGTDRRIHQHLPPAADRRAGDLGGGSGGKTNLGGAADPQSGEDAFAAHVIPDGRFGDPRGVAAGGGNMRALCPARSASGPGAAGAAARFGPAIVRDGGIHGHRGVDLFAGTSSALCEGGGGLAGDAVARIWRRSARAFRRGDPADLSRQPGLSGAKRAARHRRRDRRAPRDRAIRSDALAIAPARRSPDGGAAFERDSANRRN